MSGLLVFRKKCKKNALKAYDKSEKKCILAAEIKIYCLTK